MKTLSKKLREFAVITHDAPPTAELYTKGFESGYNEALERLTAILDAHGSGWISVEEDLPEALRPVLACYEYGGCYILYMVRGDYWNHQDGDTALPGVTHWQPLPQPPKTPKS